MVFSNILQRFINSAPISVMTRMIMENIYSSARFDAIFAQTVERQYTKELTFSTCAQLLAQVTLGTAPSVRSAFLKDREAIPVSLASVYTKLQNTELAVCEGLVRQTTHAVEGVLEHLHAGRTEPIAGYRLRILDGNVLAGTEHRITELRCSGAAALPGMTLALYNYRLGLISEVVACEDAHTNERKLLERVIPLLQANNLLLADRNFCTIDFLAAIAKRPAAFLIRHHGSLKLHYLTDWHRVGRCSTGVVFECQVRLSSGAVYRAIRIDRDKLPKGGARQIILLTNVPRKKAAGKKLAELYLKRWTIEEAFRQLTEYLACEVRTLGYPKAALLGFTLAVLAYNCLACIRGALASVHGRARVDHELSSYHMAWELKSTYEGMAIAVPAEEWEAFAQMEAPALARVLRQVAKKLDLTRYSKSKRGPKKPVKRQKVKRGAHVATAQILEERKNSKRKARCRRAKRRARPAAA